MFKQRKNLESKFLKVLDTEPVLRKAILKKEPFYRVKGPYRIYKSKIYGYKATREFIVVIGRVRKGGIEPKIPSAGRTPSNIYRKYSRSISLFDILKNKIKKKYVNCDTIKGYYLYEKGPFRWFEFILKLKKPKNLK